MSSKIKLTNANGKTLSIGHHDLLTKDKNVMYVDSVDDLANLSGSNDSDVVIVTDKDRGGIFLYDSSKASENDSGIIFNGWCRHYEEGAVNVKWFGVDSTGVIDNSDIYSTMVDKLKEGIILNFPKGIYRGSLIITKQINIEGNNSIFIPSDDKNYCIRLDSTLTDEGKIQEYSLNSAPRQGDTSLDADLPDGYYLLYSGTKRSDGQAVNFEVLDIVNNSVDGVVMSNQNGGDPKAIKLKPLESISIKNVEFQAEDAMGILGFALKNISIENINMVGGGNTTVSLRYSENVTLSNIIRKYPTKTSSGRGYNAQVFVGKNIEFNHIIGYGCRHNVDTDSCYGIICNDIYSYKITNSSLELTHNGYGDNFILNNIQDTIVSGYSINFSLGSPAKDTDIRPINNIQISNITINSLIDSNMYSIGINADASINNIEISNMMIKHLKPSSEVDYSNGVFNALKYGIRLDRLHKSAMINNFIADKTIFGVQVTFASSYASLHIDKIDIPNYRNMVRLYGAYDTYTKINNLIHHFHTNSEYSIVSTNSHHSISIGDIEYFPQLVSVENVEKCTIGDILNKYQGIHDLTIDDGVISEDQLVKSKEGFLIVSSATTLDSETPFEAIKFSARVDLIIRGSHNITIPGNSDTVANSDDLVMEPNKMYSFCCYHSKWKCYKITDSVTIP